MNKPSSTLPIIDKTLCLGRWPQIIFIGIRESSWTNTIFTVIEASRLILTIVIGFTISNPEPVNYTESPSGFTGIAIAFVLIFFAFIGFKDMANVAEEVKKRKTVL